MADMKPWEKYATQAPVADVQDGPWSKYAKPADAPVSAPQGPQEAMSAADVLSGAVSNFLPSAGQFAKDIVQPVLHPVQTAQAVGDIAGGVAAKAGIGNADPSSADAVGQFFAQRYGGFENVKRTMAQDPVGFLSDLATVFSGGALVGAKAPGVLGTVARAAGTAADIVDPLANAGRVVGGVGRAAGTVASEALGVTTGAGGDAIRGVAKAGREGNTAALEQMRDKAPISDIRDSALYGVDQLNNDRARQYNTDMAPARADTTVLNFRGIDQALNDAKDMVHFKGVVKNHEGADIVSQMQTAVDDWKKLAPADYHTPIGFDALKQTLGGIRDNTEAGTVARKVADKVYREVRDNIETQVPSYAAAMRGYENASNNLNEIRRTLSLREGATEDTALRKLLTTTRNNVNTNFGTRQKLVEQLAKYEPSLPGMLAGRALSGLSPKGLARIPLAAGGAGFAAMSGLTPVTAAVGAAGLAASSPRLVGETAYKVGQAGRVMNKLTPMQRRLLGRLLAQAGRSTAPVSDEQRQQRGY
jgi:hypothetical protein